MSQINKPTDYFNTKLYTGTGSSNSVDVGFQTDFTWIKDRDSGAAYHYLYDTVRGAGKAMYSNDTAAEATNLNNLASFDSSGFTVGTGGGVNASGNNFASWNWLAGGTASSNTDGSITSSVSANQTAGFSIVSYTGDGSVGSTIGHGLGVAPKVVIIKNRSVSYRWVVGHNDLTSWDYYLSLNETSAQTNANNPFNDTAPSSTVVTLGNNTGANGSGESMIAYCFAEKKGFSKFGKYTGNGSTDGTFVYTGFKPAWVMVKATNGVYHWKMYDNKRDIDNPVDKEFSANLPEAEADSTRYIDFLSNGFKLRHTNSNGNGSGVSYIYMCFAENPLVGTNNIPACAR